MSKLLNEELLNFQGNQNRRSRKRYTDTLEEVEGTNLSSNLSARGVAAANARGVAAGTGETTGELMPIENEIPCDEVEKPTDRQLECYCETPPPPEPENFDCDLVLGTLNGTYAPDIPKTLPPFIKAETQGGATVYRFDVTKFLDGGMGAFSQIDDQYNQAYYNEKFNTWIIQYKESALLPLLKLLASKDIVYHALHQNSPLKIDGIEDFNNKIVQIAIKQDFDVTGADGWNNDGWYIALICNAKEEKHEIKCDDTLAAWERPTAAVPTNSTISRTYIVRSDTGDQLDLRDKDGNIQSGFELDCVTAELLQRNKQAKEADKQAPYALYWIETGQTFISGKQYRPMRWIEEGYWLCLSTDLPELIDKQVREEGSKKIITETYKYAYWILDPENMPQNAPTSQTRDFAKYLENAIVGICDFTCTTETVEEINRCKDTFTLCCKHLGFYDESDPTKTFEVKALDPEPINAPHSDCAIGTERNPYNDKVYFYPNREYSTEKCKYIFVCPSVEPKDDPVTPYVQHDTITIEGENPFEVGNINFDPNNPLSATKQHIPTVLGAMMQNIGDDKIQVRDNNIDMLSTVFQYKPIHNFANWLNSANLNDNNWEALTKKLGDVFVSIWQNGVSQTTLITLIGKVFGAKLTSETSVNLTPTEFVLLLEVYKAIKDEIIIDNLDVDKLNQQIKDVLLGIGSPIRTLDQIAITIVSADGSSQRSYTLQSLLYITPDEFKQELIWLGYGNFLNDPMYTYRRRRYLGDGTTSSVRTVQAGEAQLDAYFVQYGEEEPFWLIYDPLLNKYYTWEEGTCNLIPCECPREPEPDPDIQPCTCIWLLSLIDKVVDRIVALENAIKAANPNIIIPALDAELANLKQTIKNMPESEKNRPI